ncbi:unnamed protein product [Pylaiella littoralis]
MLVPSFSWRSSQPGSAAAAAEVAVADGSAPAPAVQAPSAPPVPSSEVSLATSNSSNLHSASSSFSGGAEEAETAAAAAAAAVAAVAAVAAAATGSAGLPSVRNDRDSCPCLLPPSGAASSIAKANGMDSVERSARCSGGDGGDGGDGGGSAGAFFSRPPAVIGHRRERSSGDDGRCRSSYSRFSFEEADEAAKENAKGARNSQEEERRMSPPWDDSTLGLLGLSPDELVDRVLRAEKSSHFWKAQLKLVERKLAVLETTTATTMTCSQREGIGSGGNGTASVPPVVDDTPAEQNGSVDAASRAGWDDRQGATENNRRSGGGGGSCDGGGGGRTTGDDFSNSRGLLASPQDGVAYFRSTFRGGIGRSGSSGSSGGDGGSAEDGWKERSPGVGPWPLSEQTREGRASLNEKQGVSNGGGGSIGATSVDGKLSTRGIEENETKTNAKRTAAAAAAAEGTSAPYRLRGSGP